MKHTWLTDCCSLRDHLLNPTFARCSDKRLSIDMAAMRQLIWLDDNDEPRDSLDESCSDMLRWIDTTAMIADCLTKAMKPGRLIDALQGHLDLRATPEGELVKLRRQKAKLAEIMPEENHGCEITR